MFSARQRSQALAELLQREHAAMAEFIEALAQFDREQQWIHLGHSSLFYYLHRELNLSAGAAYYRKTATRLVQQFPEILDALRDGRLCISTVSELAKVITPQNRAEVIPRFFHASKRSAKELAAELRPEPSPPLRTVIAPVNAARLEAKSSPHVNGAVDVPASDRLAGKTVPLDASAACGLLATAPPAVVPGTAAPSTEAGTGAPSTEARFEASDPNATRATGCDDVAAADQSAPAKPARPSDVEALTGDLSRLHVTVTKAFVEKLEAARYALSHLRVGATIEAILEAGLDLILEAHATAKGIVKNPRKNPPASGSDAHIPAHVKREVWKRDRGCCQWALASGGICRSRLRLEYDHRVPRARGGPSTAANIRLLARVHNELAAQQAFGAELMADAISAARSKRSATRPAPAGGADRDAGRTLVTAAREGTATRGRRRAPPTSPGRSHALLNRGSARADLGRAAPSG